MWLFSNFFQTYIKTFSFLFQHYTSAGKLDFHLHSSSVNSKVITRIISQCPKTTVRAPAIENPNILANYSTDGGLLGGLTDTVGKTVGGVTNTAGGIVGGLGNTVGGATEGLGQTVSGATEGLGNTTKGAGNTVGQGVSSVGGKDQTAENPLGLNKQNF